MDISKKFRSITNVYNLIFSFISSESLLYYFPVAAITKYHTLDDLKQEFILSQSSWRSEFSNQSYWWQRGYGPSGCSREDCPLPLSVSGGCTQSCLWLHHSNFCLHGHVASFCASNLPLPLSHKVEHLLWHLESTQIIQNNFPTSWSLDES